MTSKNVFCLLSKSSPKRPFLQKVRQIDKILGQFDVGMILEGASRTDGPLVNRHRAVVQIVKNFVNSYSRNGEGRPCVSFAPAVYGNGTTWLEKCFKEFSELNKEIFVTAHMSDASLPEDTKIGEAFCGRVNKRTPRCFSRS
jgi:hypothetical protein